MESDLRFDPLTMGLRVVRAAGPVDRGACVFRFDLRAGSGGDTPSPIMLISKRAEVGEPSKEVFAVPGRLYRPEDCRYWPAAF